MVVGPLGLGTVTRAVGARYRDKSMVSQSHESSKSDAEVMADAISNDDLLALAKLLAQGKLNFAGAQSHSHRPAGSPVHQAVLQDRLVCAEFLVNNGADINARDKTGLTAAHHAVSKLKKSAADSGATEWVVAKGADLYQPDFQDRRPCDMVDASRLLAAAGTSIPARRKDNNPVNASSGTEVEC